MKQHIISLDDQTNALVEQAAEQAHMPVADFIRHTTMLYLARQKMELPAGPRRHAQPAPMAADGSSDGIYDQFAAFLNEKLRDCRQPYICSYQICPESYVDWVDPRLYAGTTAESSHALRRLCGEKLREAVATGDETLCFEAVRLAMDWGKSYYNHRLGVLKGNESIVCALHESGELLQVIRRGQQAIADGRIGDLEYYTTGWSIVWNILDEKRTIIMGTREMYAYNCILAEFKRRNNIPALPASLELGQLAYKKNRRHISGVPYVYTLKGKLRMLERLLRVLEAVIALGDMHSMTEIDEKLYMLGE